MTLNFSYFSPGSSEQRLRVFRFYIVIIIKTIRLCERSFFFFFLAMPVEQCYDTFVINVIVISVFSSRKHQYYVT